MDTLHAKSPCCRARVYHFGGRRRQCARCKRTWRIREKRRGRKRLRDDLTTTRRRLESGTSLRRLATFRHVGRERLRRRHRRGMEALEKHLPSPHTPGGKLLAIIDGLWFRFSGVEYTLYVVLLRAVWESTAILQEPMLLLGHESATGWRQVLGTLPRDVQRRIVALVSDGVTGVEALAEERGWILQRCHFHLLAQLQQFRGRRNRFVAVRPLRERIYQTVRRVLAVTSARDAERHIHLLRRLLARPDCPRWLGRRVRGFLGQLSAFRAYRKFPRLHLPTTTNTAESVGNLLRTVLYRTRGFRTPAACRRWLTITARLHPTFRCNGADHQPK